MPMFNNTGSVSRLTRRNDSTSVAYGVEQETASLVRAAQTPLTLARMALIDTCIAGLKANGVWQKMDVIYCNAGPDAQFRTLNWKDPGKFPLVQVGSVTFTADRGDAGDGSTGYFTTGWIPSTHGVNYTQNSASLFGWSRTAANGVSNGGFIGGGTVGTYRLCPRGTTDFTFYTANDSIVRGPANTDGSGLFGWSRTGASAVQLYRNGAAFGAADTTASTTIPGGQLNLLRTGTTFFSSAQIAFGAAGGGLDTTENANFHSVLSTYMTAIGVV